MGMARQKRTDLFLALVVFSCLLVVSGCAGLEATEEAVAGPSSADTSKDQMVRGSVSCRSTSSEPFGSHYEGILEWTPDGTQLVFDSGLRTFALLMSSRELRALTSTSASGSYISHRSRYGKHADISPDGAEIAFSCDFRNETYEIVVINLESGEWRWLTENADLEFFPEWSPDGKRIAYISDAEGSGKLGLYTMAADGTDMRRIAPPEGRVALAPPVWSPDGEFLAFVMGGFEDYSLHLYTVRRDGSELRKIAKTVYVIKPPSHHEYAPAVPAWSPDGRYLAFIGGNVARDHDRFNTTVYEEEEAAIYTVRADGTELRQVLTLRPQGPAPYALGFAFASGVFYPYFPKISQVLWSPDGTELLFFANGAHLINLDGSNLRRLSPPVLDGVAAWSPDGKRIAVYERGNAESPQVIWTAEGHFRTLENDEGERVLLTVARDGSDLQTLIEEQGVLFLPRKTPVEASVDLAVCKEGVVVSEPVANPGLVADCEALLQSRDMLSNTLNLKWNAETPLVEWEGVTLGGEPLRVHELGLERMNGVLPPELGQLSELRRLEIRGVGSKESRYIGFRLSGGIPAEIGNLQNLEVLDLSGNFLTGFIPVELSGLQRLETLWLEDNFLSGSIPPELGALASLRYLNLGRNNLSGGVPAELGSLSQLQELHLWSNQLTGSIPPELGNLTQLQRLSLSVNRLSGEIPPELGNLSQLTALWLSSNRLTGSLPPELGSLSQLVNLYLTNNQLDGSIPAELGSLSQLERLHLSYNQLEGSIPAEMSNLSQLRWLELSANTFSGCVAAELPDIWVEQSELERCA